MPLGMNLATILLCVTTFAAHAEATPAQIFGRGRSVPEDSAENDTMEKLMAGARHISPPTGRRLSSPLDKVLVVVSLELTFEAKLDLTLYPFEICSWRS